MLRGRQAQFHVVSGPARPTTAAKKPVRHLSKKNLLRLSSSKRPVARAKSAPPIETGRAQKRWVRVPPAAVIHRQRASRRVPPSPDRPADPAKARQFSPPRS